MSLATVHADVRAAFRTKLRDLMAGFPVAWEGVSYFPVFGTPFASERIVPVSDSVASVGALLIAHRFACTVTLHYPSGAGTKDIEAQAGAIMTEFKPGTPLAYGQTAATILQIERRPLVVDADWITCPVIATAVAYSA
jgi:hypothetical protein